MLTGCLAVAEGLPAELAATAASTEPEVSTAIAASTETAMLIESASPAPIFIAPLHEGGVRKNRGINIPLNTRLAPRLAITAGFTASNSYLNPGSFVCSTGDCELEYETDHTGNLFHIDVDLPLFEWWELGIGVGTYRMGNVPDASLPHRLVADRLLRVVHEDLLGEDSLPSASGAPDGRQRFSMTDFDGRRLTLEPDRSYALPLRLSLTRYFVARQSADAQLGVNLGLHVSHPLEGGHGDDAGAGATAFARGVDAGLSVNIVRSRRVTANVTSTFHLQLARFRSDIHVVHPGSPLNADDDRRSQYALTYGLGFANTFGGRAPCAFSIGQVSSSAHIDKARGWAYDPVVFEGGNNLRGALAGANDYGVLTLGCRHGRQYFQLALVEDFAGFSQLFADDGAGTSYDPDFAVGLSASWLLGTDTNRGI